ncbi:MAG: aldo/keto reductase [Candidatus Riflebacteria bacterium]|nr:aldo/keto reductase [Candidatus Riflebacteria bacterium]
MEKITLGKTGILVSRLAFGTLTMSPFQRNLSAEEGASVILAALERGVSFIDTAQMYGSYPQVKAALNSWKGNPPVISTKSTAETGDSMKQAIEEACQALNLDRIDIFLMHAVKDQEALEKRKPALGELLEAKRAGRIKAIGLSTHSVQLTRIAAEIPEIDIIHPIINMAGYGNLDGSRDEMIDNVSLAARNGKGIYAMKPLGGGNLKNEASKALKWIISQKNVHSVCTGMTSVDEVIMNCAIFEGKSVEEEFEKKIAKLERKLFVNTMLCSACNKCVDICQSGALEIVNGKLNIEHSRCLLCGYCAPECPRFALRII